MTQFDQRYQQVESQYNADHITIQQQPLSRAEKQRKQNRARMLQRVQAIWIDGVLQPSLQGAAQIALGLEHKSTAIVTPLWHVLREFDTTGQLSSENASIVQVYDHASGEVLILGEPGSGKTTLLLKLTRTLLERAGQDEAHPIPVVFPLSSWATKRQPLTTWLASELHSSYQVPLLLATSWIETEQVLPLLDGLDEVAVSHREACVEAINAYRQAHGLIPTVVCSRQTDYFALTTRLLLRTAVVVQPLTPEQIASYLTSGGERLEALRLTLREDADLRELASTPLMLNVLTAAYQGTTPKEIVAAGSFGIKHEQVFASYVQRMLSHRNTNVHYTPEQTIHWLAWLAKRLEQQSQTEFYIEQIQPDWLSKKLPRWLNFKVSTTFLECLILMLLSMLAIGLINVFIFGFIGRMIQGVVVGLIIGLIVGLIIIWFVWLYDRHDKKDSGADTMQYIPPMLYVSSLRILWEGILFWLRKSGRNKKTGEWRSGQRDTLLGKITVGLLSMMLICLVVGLLIWLRFGLLIWLRFGLYSGLIVSLFVVLLGALSGSISVDTLIEADHITTGQVFWRSARWSIFVGLLIGLVFALLFVLLFSPIGGPIVALNAGLIYGLLIWLVFGLLSGGIALINYAILRLLLWRSGSIPWRYIRFLDYATERLLLRKIGGGYIFLHRLLLNYFANLENESGFISSEWSSQKKLSSDAMPSTEVVPTEAGEQADMPTVSLVPTPVLSDIPHLLPCGHEQRSSNARFCSICGKPVPSSSLE